MYAPQTCVFITGSHGVVTGTCLVWFCLVWLYLLGLATSAWSGYIYLSAYSGKIGLVCISISAHWFENAIYSTSMLVCHIYNGMLQYTVSWSE